jgi:restriction system protein
MGLNHILDPMTQAMGSALLSLWPVWVLFGAVILIRLVLFWYAQQRLQRAGIAEIDQMSGPMFERRLAVLFRDLGYGVTHTGTTGDFGADLVISKNGTRTVVQAKRYREKRVGVKAVQESVAAMSMYHSTAALVVTNSRFTTQAETLARANGVELWDRDQLVNRLLAAQASQPPSVAPAAEAQPVPAAATGPTCPRCGSTMVLRTAQRGARQGEQFYGCANYPRCRGTVGVGDT